MTQSICLLMAMGKQKYGYTIFQNIYENFRAVLEFTVDETMDFWLGVSEVKPMFNPRNPLGIILKTTVDTATGIFINADKVKNAEGGLKFFIENVARVL